MAPYLGALDEERLSYAWTHPDARMDRLQAAVAELVEDAARTDEPAPATFARIHPWSGHGGIPCRRPPTFCQSGS